jgi:phage N-6-adenine-methyltransferase
VNAFHSRTDETRDDWQTPLELVHALGRFELDPCANLLQPTRCADFGLTELHDGLALPWDGKRAFVNPPYGRKARAWLAKLAEHRNGIALIPPRMGAKWFHETVLAHADAILFLKGRVAFLNAVTGQPVKGNNADSILIAYGQENVEALRNCDIPGKVWEL